jgi:hypothetical protein
MPTDPHQVPVDASPEAARRRLHIHGIKEMPAGYDAEVAELFRDLRAASNLTENDLAAKLKTRPEVVQALEQGALYALPPWPETCQVVNAYGSLLNLDIRPLLRRIYAQLEAGIVELKPKPVPEVPTMTPQQDAEFTFEPDSPPPAPSAPQNAWPPASPYAPPQNSWAGANNVPPPQAQPAQPSQPAWPGANGPHAPWPGNNAHGQPPQPQWPGNSQASPPAAWPGNSQNPQQQTPWPGNSYGHPPNGPWPGNSQAPQQQAAWPGNSQSPPQAPWPGNAQAQSWPASGQPAQQYAPQAKPAQPRPPQPPSARPTQSPKPQAAQPNSGQTQVPQRGNSEWPGQQRNPPRRADDWQEQPGLDQGFGARNQKAEDWQDQAGLRQDYGTGNHQAENWQNQAGLQQDHEARQQPSPRRDQQPPPPPVQPLQPDQVDAAFSADPVVPPPAPAPVKSRKRPALLKWGLVALLVSLIAFGIWYALGEISGPSDTETSNPNDTSTPVLDPDDPRSRKADRLPDAFQAPPAPPAPAPQ